MPSITAIVSELAACLQCRSDTGPAEGNSSKAAAANVNKIVNITVSPSHKTSSDQDAVNPRRRKPQAAPMETENECGHLASPVGGRLKNIRNQGYYNLMALDLPSGGSTGALSIHPRY